MKLENKIVFITGASSGVGACLARVMAKEKCRLILVSNESVPLNKISMELNSYANSVESECFDLTDFDATEKFIEGILKRYGYIDILFNYAGILIPERLGESSFNNWRKVLTLNLDAPFFLSNAFIPSMNKHSESPLIVNMNSISGIMGSPFCASYVASKFGLVGLTEAINEEFRINGRIRSISICPGPMDTPGRKKLVTIPELQENLAIRFYKQWMLQISL